MIKLSATPSPIWADKSAVSKILAVFDNRGGDGYQNQSRTVKRYKPVLFKTPAAEENSPESRTRLNPKYNMGKWGIYSQRAVWGSRDEK